MKNYYTSLFITFAFSFLSASYAQNNNTVLDFDGVDDFVNIPHDPSLNLINFTIEAWVKTTQNIPFARLVTKSVGGQQSYSLCVNNGKAHIRFDNGFDANSTESTININDGNWHHIAGVRNSSTNRLEIYVDGVLNNVEVKAGNPIPGTESVSIGRFSATFPTPTFVGQLDEVRIWNRALSQSEIQQGLSVPLTGNETGLVAYYPFQEGIGGADNTAITTIVDQANGNNGTPQNFAQSGNNSNWISDQSFITSTPNTNTALDFDGLNDYVQYTNPVSGSLRSTSFWVKTTKTTEVLICSGIYISRFSNNGRVYAFMDGSTGNGDSSANESTKAVNDGNWHYIAATNDGNTTRLYIDGVLEASYVDAYTQFNPENIGGIVASNESWLDGQVDEYAVWDKVLTQDEIVSQMSGKLTGNESGLALYFDFEEGIANGNNSATGGDITQVVDQAGSNNGSINNFDRTGTSSNWVEGKAFSSGNTAMDFDGVNDYINLGSPLLPTTDPNAPNTIEMWVKGRNNANVTSLFSQYVISGPEFDKRFAIYLQADGLPRVFKGGFYNIVGTTNLKDDQWHHLAFVKEASGTVRLYVDGVQEATATDNQVYVNSNSFLGYLSQPGSYYEGIMDEVRVWNIARSETEIQSSMNTPLTGSESGLVAYYDFEEGVEFADNTSLTKIFDKAGSNDGTLVDFAKTGTTSNWVSGTNRIGATNTWLGITSDWATASNWSYEIVPVASNDVLISDVANQPIIGHTTSANARNLNLEANTRLDVEGVLNVTGNILNDGQITFKSDASSTGQLDEFSGTISGAGSVTVERFIPGSNRAFRLLSTPVTSSGTIFDNWQQGGLNPGDANYEANLGTHITGDTAGNNGFDATQSGNASMFGYNNGNYTDILNTDNTSLIAGEAYTIFIRGDRTAANISATPSGVQETTLRTTGLGTDFRKGQVTLNTGSTPQLNNTPGEYNLIANPYQSIVDLCAVDRTNLSNTIWVRNVASGSNGAWVSLDIDGTANAGGLCDPNAPPAPTSNSSQFIQPGSAFFIETTTASPTITFEEADKATDASQPLDIVFNETSMFYVNARLYLSSELQNGDVERDAFGLRFDDKLTSLGSAEDSDKFINPDENIGIVNNGLKYIDKQAMPSIGHHIQLETTGYTASTYSLVFTMANLPENMGIFINDAYLGTQTELTDAFVFDFMVDANIPESIASDRFSLVFNNTTLGVAETTFGYNFRLYPNPNQGKFNVKTPNLSGEVNVEITNLLGQRVYKEQLFIENQSIEVFANNLVEGIYILKLSQDDNTMSQKFIIK
jgi:hypothetical protein